VKDLKVVRKTELVVGILLMFVGVILSSSSNLSSVEVTQRDELVSRSVNQWNVTGSFNEGEKLSLVLVEPQEGPMLLGGFNVSIVDPIGNETVFYYDLLGTGGPSGPTLQYNVSVVKNEGGLEVPEDAHIIGGITNYAGNYIACVDKIATLWYKGPPSVLTFYKTVEDKHVEFPHRNLLPWGLTLFFVGLGLQLWAVAFRKTRVSQKGKR
jgi:hypothetical protein